jgi:hypothetical protein
MSEEIGLKLREQQVIQKKTTKKKMSESERNTLAKIDFSLSGTLNLPLGSTFSHIHYEEYKKMKSKDIFERIVDSIMIDCIFNDDFTFKEILYIKGTKEHEIKAIEIKAKILDPNNIGSKRLMINKLLNSNNPFYGRVVDIYRNCKSKREYIIQLNYILKEYLGVHKGDKEEEFRKSVGEVTTPLELVEEMLDTLPKEVWSNPNLKWADVANGVGPYPCVVILRLMEGLAEWQPDEELLYKHIIENMLYICELQPINMFLYLFTIDTKDTLDTNIYCGSFLDTVFDFHMKYVWNIEKFDIIIGNPPYNRGLYLKFITKCLQLTDKLLYVVPSNFTLNINEVKYCDLLKHNGLQYVKFLGFDAFKVNQATLFFYLDKLNKNNQLKINDIIFNNDVEIHDYKSEIELSILEKVSKIEKIVLNQGANDTNNYKNKIETENIRFTQSNEFNIKMLSRLGGGKDIEFYFIKNNKDPKSKKVVFPRGTANYNSKTNLKNLDRDFTFNMYLDENTYTSKSIMWISVSSSEEAELMSWYIARSKYIRYIFLKYNTFEELTKKMFKFIPKLALKEKSDEHIYSLLGLNENEIKYIEDFIENA